jgi:hypothetical protein
MEKHKRRFIKYKQLKEGCVVMISGLMNINDLHMSENIEDTKGLIRSRKPKKYRHYNGQQKKDKTNNDQWLPRLD